VPSSVHVSNIHLLDGGIGVQTWFWCVECVVWTLPTVSLQGQLELMGYSSYQAKKYGGVEQNIKKNNYI